MAFSFSVSFSSKALAQKGETLFKQLNIKVVTKMAYPGSIQYYMASAPTEALFDQFANEMNARKTGANALLVNK